MHEMPVSSYNTDLHPAALEGEERCKTHEELLKDGCPCGCIHLPEGPGCPTCDPQCEAPGKTTMRGICIELCSLPHAYIAVIRITFTTEKNNNCQMSTCAEDQVLLFVGKHGKAQCVDCTFQLQTHWLLRTSLYTCTLFSHRSLSW